MPDAIRMTSVKASSLFAALCVLGLLARVAEGAEAPATEPTTSADVTARAYDFELQTLNLGDAVRRKQIEFTVDDAMSDDELAAVSAILDELGASRADENGYRNFSMSNGTRARLGGFAEEESGGAIRSMPMKFSMAGEFSTLEAALVLRIAAAGNLFVANPADVEQVATAAAIDDRRFKRAHKRAAVTPDEATLAQWVRQNIPSSTPPPPR